MYEGRDELAIIQEDIKRALAKPERKWAMLIDLRRCVLCHACTAGCVAEQKSPPGIIYRPVYEEEMGIYPDVKRRYTPRPCQQCDNPPCVQACPNKGEGKATWKSTKGIECWNCNDQLYGMYRLWSLCGCLSLQGKELRFRMLSTPRALRKLKPMKPHPPGNIQESGLGRNTTFQSEMQENATSVITG